MRVRRVWLAGAQVWRSRAYGNIRHARLRISLQRIAVVFELRMSSDCLQSSLE